MNKLLFLIPAAILLIIVVIAVINSSNSTNSNGQCIITVSGNKYNVTELQSTHSGGDIFECGTDMSEAFAQEHKTRFGMIQQYLIP